ncbi:chromosome 11 open reading frame 73 [Seminavis robusta]|uniref:Chromosome 11 open reading frame 73 n=1 Tax=Seminavis robusta TaxID=568900 RepID=A0A9N8EK31_9STRA|nr:chromosome 11 open reading frame 73 [Seminavis robusta]|eukprot:Sro1088_g239990.1 chromosome 11 open reading frame 73 (230) ;mRNA; f:18011-18700
MDVDFSSEQGFKPPAVANDNMPTPLCGFFVPGGPVRSDFVPMDPTGIKRTLQLSSPGDLPSPLASVTELACFLWPNVILPEGQGLSIYWQISGLPDPSSTAPPPSTGFELLGALVPGTQSSQVFRTGWSEHEQLLDIMSRNIPVVVTIGIGVEPLTSIHNIRPVDRLENRMVVAQKIAKDLFKYMQSFDTGGSYGQMMVPTNIFDRWMKRFEARFRRDPNFFLKASDDD